MKKLFYFVFCALFLVVLSGCPKKPLVQPPEVKPREVKPPVVKEVPEEAKVIEPEIRGKESAPVLELKTIYFDFDKYDLLSEAQTVLQNNVDYLKKVPELKVLIEGHCCECGTVEYNLGLGDKRAKTVRDYYIQLGIASDRIATITYGEEKPANKSAGPPDSPKCSANRRAETKTLIEKK